MPRTRAAYPPEFRQRMVELVRSRRSPEALAKEFEPTGQTIRRWVKRLDLDEGRRSDGLTTDEQAEVRQLRRKVKALEMERDILEKAAAWFARESDSIPGDSLQAGYEIGPKDCTLGPTGIRVSNGESIFLTNSHCTYTTVAPDGHDHTQPDLGSTVGEEILDPYPVTCASPPHYACRDADVAMIEASDPIALGKVARTTTSSNCDHCLAGIVVDHSNPTISITGTRTWNVDNERLDKVGATSGWTYGDVEDTCTDHDKGSYVLLCSDRVDFSVHPGDSGSPVFKYSGGTATLRGIVHAWQGWPYNDGVISPLSGIQADMGAVVYYDPGPPSASITGLTAVQTGLQCTWSANVSNGIDPSTYGWTGLWTGSGSSLNKVATSSGWLYLTVTDVLGRSSGSYSFYITVSPGGPTPPGCSE